MDGWFKAVNAKTGALLWKFKTPSGIIGNPITYTHGGKQYVAHPLRRRGLGGTRPGGRADRTDRWSRRGQRRAGPQELHDARWRPVGLRAVGHCYDSICDTSFDFASCSRLASLRMKKMFRFCCALLTLALGMARGAGRGCAAARLLRPGLHAVFQPGRARIRKQDRRGGRKVARRHTRLHLVHDARPGRLRTVHSRDAERPQVRRRRSTCRMPTKRSRPTEPYYISSYVFIFPKSKHYDITSMDSPVLQRLRIGYETETPRRAALKIRALTPHSTPVRYFRCPGASPDEILKALASRADRGRGHVGAGGRILPALAAAVDGRRGAELAQPRAPRNSIPSRWPWPRGSATRSTRDRSTALSKNTRRRTRCDPRTLSACVCTSRRDVSDL